MRYAFQNHKGQTLIAIIFLSLLATLMGVSISSRFISSLRNYTGLDNSYKATAAAESVVEKLLLFNSDQLSEFINTNNCGSNCTYSVTDFTGQPISASATLSFSGNSAEPFSLNLDQNDFGTVSLTGYASNSTVSICWDGQTSIYGSYVYDSSGTLRAVPYSYNSVSSPYIGNGFSNASASHGFANCFNVTTTGTPKFLRLKSYYGRTLIYVVPAVGMLIPTQGILIESTGRSADVTKVVRVLKTDPMALPFFDYAILQTASDSNLTNSSD